MGRPLGWAGTLSPRGPGMGFPLCLGSSLGLGWVTGQSWGRIVQAFQFGQGVDVTFCCTWLDAAETEARLRRGQGGSRTAPTGAGVLPPPWFSRFLPTHPVLLN